MLVKRIFPCLDVTGVPLIKAVNSSRLRDAGGPVGIAALCDIESEGVQGVICGRSIYSGDLDFAAAQACADELLI